jgi:uncharacterized protein with PQ loop repeat
MDFFYWMMLIGGLMLVGIIYLKFFYPKRLGEPIIVNYSEKIGETIIHDIKEYTGRINIKDDKFIIPDKKGFLLPVPPRMAMCSTFGGSKKVFLIKFDNDRWGYRIPSLNNEVMTYKRDDKGNIVKDIDNQAVLIKHNWQLCDDVVEPDMKHWDDYMQEMIKEKHAKKMSMLEKWIYPISMVLIFLFAVIMINQINKSNESHWAGVMAKAEGMEKDAKQTQQFLNNLINKMSGTEVLPQEQPKTPNESPSNDNK